MNSSSVSQVNAGNVFDPLSDMCKSLGEYISKSIAQLNELC